MGHERIGVLPKTKRWIKIVDELAGHDLAQDKVEIAASKTLDNVRTRFSQIESDSGVLASFKFLVAFAVAAQFENPIEFLFDSQIEIGPNFSPYYVAKALNKFVSSDMDSLEYGEIARTAAVDAISAWHNVHSRQLRIFDTDQNALETWRGISKADGFCELSRLFFAKTTERYLNYFLERALSENSSTLDERELLRAKLSEHLDIASRHAFETAKITQSFAAGWFNKHARKKIPKNKDIHSFLHIAFGKLREELRREEVK